MGKHFLKTLIIFTIMIAVGLVGVFLASYFSKENAESSTSTEVAN